MKQIEFELAYHDYRNPKGYKMPWKGYKSTTPGLVVCRAPEYGNLDKPSTGWQIIHKRSGVLVRGGYETRRHALAMAERLSSTADWTQSEEYFSKNSGKAAKAVLNRVKEIMDEQTDP